LDYEYAKVTISSRPLGSLAGTSCCFPVLVLRVCSLQMGSGSSGPYGPRVYRGARQNASYIGWCCSGTSSSGARGTLVVLTREPLSGFVSMAARYRAALTQSRVSPLIIVHVILWLCLHARFAIALGASFNQPTSLPPRISMRSFSSSEPLVTTQRME